MKMVLLFVAFCHAVVCLALPSASAGTTAPIGDYPHFHFKEQRTRTLDRTRVAVQLPAGMKLGHVGGVLQKNGLDAQGATSWPIGHWYLIPITAPAQTPVETVVAALSQHANIAYASPVFVGFENLIYWPTQNVMVEFADGAAAPTRDALLRKAGAKNADYRWAIMPNAALVELTTKNGFDAIEAANVLAASNLTTFAECDTTQLAKHSVIPNDEFFPHLWGVHNTGEFGGTPDVDMDGAEAWELTTGVSSVISVVLETGVQQGHPDLNCYTPGMDFTGQGTAGDPGNIYDNHGTAVASCIAARINNTIGVCGIAPSTRVASARVGTAFDSAGHWTGNASWRVDAINWAATIGARVTNFSSGLSSASAALETAYQTTHDTNNIVHFASAGNDSAGAIDYPASIPVVNAVAAIDDEGQLASFSNFGTGLDFAAPGDGIYACDRTGEQGYEELFDYTVIDGTSFASPYAAGVAALTISRHPSLSAAQVETLMRNSATDLGAAADDTTFGYGLVNAYGSVLGALPTPANNLCSNATVISLGTVTGTSTNATTNGSSSCASGFALRDVYFSFTPTCSATYRFNTCGSAFDTVISVHSSCPASAGNTIACNDDQGAACATNAQTSRVDVTLTAGTAYIIRIAGINASGAYTLTTTQLDGLPSNDNCTGAAVMTLGVTYSGDTSCASIDGATSCSIFTPTRDVWYAFTPSCNGTYLFSMCGSGYDTVLSVHTGCPGTTANQLACNDDTCALQSQVSVVLSAGTTYRVRVAGFQGAIGPFTILATRIQGPQVNDLCANATPITAGNTGSGSTACAAADGAAGCVTTASPDVWYSFTADCSGFYSADTLGSTYDTVLSIHTGCSGDAGNQVACNDDWSGLLSRVVWFQAAGTTYRIRVSGFSGATGNYVLHMGNTPNNACADAVSISNGATNFSNRGASTDGLSSGLCPGDISGGQVNLDIWFVYQATCSGLATVDTCDALGYDSIIAAYEMQPCPPTNALTCNDDANTACPANGRRSQITFLVSQGNSYLIRVGGYGSAAGCGVLNIACTPSGCWGVCVADFDDGSGTGTPDGGVTIDDLLYYLSLFSQGLACADVDDGSGTGTLDGGVTIDDLLYYLARFSVGC